MSALTKLRINGGWWQFSEPLRNLEPFSTGGAMHGTDKPGRVVGQLPEMYWESFHTAVYAVFSYQTPIAWYTSNGEWVAPPIKYSVTTSKQQGRIFTALSQL